MLTVQGKVVTVCTTCGYCMYHVWLLYVPRVVTVCTTRLNRDITQGVDAETRFRAQTSPRGTLSVRTVTGAGFPPNTSVSPVSNIQPMSSQYLGIPCQ